ncbi:glycoside hydrolase family 2 protein [Paenibacillus kobensis]|uniref:hypothetical protein n=1 Tax=Paenibacillus kobensis TaxID=59841 RepID=UPI000FDBCD9A|nr:hypothetical protein [Paenibacillus kobensis]
MKRLYIIGVMILVAVLLPIVLWLLEDENELRIAIIDKTVPDESYREHLGVTWLLNHLKYTTDDGRSYDRAADYKGFVPKDNGQSYEIRPLPTQYDDYDVIYMADTYGVYEEDLPGGTAPSEGSPSGKLYGGLEEEEWRAIAERLIQPKKSLFISEFNTFASPTDPAVRKQVTDYMGIDWNGWTGRFFDELDPERNDEIPKSLVDQYEAPWTYQGPGFILVNDMTGEVVVLELSKHVTEKGIRLSFTDEGSKRFGLNESPNYEYWFDIVTARPGTEVLANYKWSLTDDGKALLEQKGIPAEFAAVVAMTHRMSTSYYNAGDYNDTRSVPKFYQMKGLPSLYKLLEKYSDQSFYWSTYYPMMQSILERFEEAPAEAATANTGQLSVPARVQGDKIEVKKDGVWTPMTIKGVNIGMSKPGAFPGEAAITEDEYYRWFEDIGEMNANTIRVFTLHPPGFYNALKRYNESHKQPIYVMHGVWINEESLEDSLDAFDKDNVEQFHDEMKNIVDVIHGNKIVHPEPGHSSGVYQSDISEYVIGWIIGIEWYPFMVDNTNKVHDGIGEYSGAFFETKGARPFEYWLAQQMDYIAQYDKKQYNSVRPMSFTNWVTTDLLTHPADSSGKEDLVTVDPNVIYEKAEMKLAGQFASYNIYPYYPDFLNYNPHYLTYVDHRGERNNYAAYLNELHAAHRLPILVAEYGVPGSRGKTHENPFGMNQGFLSEKEQGEIAARLYEDIMAEGLLGGIVFIWQDEWFKRTWNTMDYDDPNRRPYWSNAQTSEQQFGLLGFDRLKIKVDGNGEEWTNPPLYEKDGGILHKLTIDHDERYLYLRLDYDKNKAVQGFPTFMLDVVPGQGNTFIQGNKSVKFSNGVDFLAELNGAKSRLTVDSYYDIFNFQYGHLLGLVNEKPASFNSGVFNPILYALNKDYYLPTEKRTIPFVSYETGKLKEGNGNPEADSYDSLTDYSIGPDGVIELRIPWLLIQSMDPSRKEFMGDFTKQGMGASVSIDQIRIGAMFMDEQGTMRDSFPRSEKGLIAPMKGYTWDNWETPKYQERLKQSYYILKETYGHQQ